MKRLAFVPVVLLLASCGPTTPSIDTAALQVVIGKVVHYTKEICRFVPSDATVTGIIVSMGIEAASAHGIATLICKAVANVPDESPAAALFGIGEEPVSSCLAVVEGVCVEGQFLGAEQVEDPDAVNPQPAPVPEETAP